MTITVNGESREVADRLTLAELLDLLEVQKGQVAVERNLSVVPRRELDGVVLEDGDKLEIVTLVGGG